MSRVRVRQLTKSVDGYRALTLCTFPSCEAALDWLATTVLYTDLGLCWIDTRQAPAILLPRH